MKSKSETGAGQCVMKSVLISLGVAGIIAFVLPVISFALLNIWNLLGIFIGVLLLLAGIFYEKVSKVIIDMKKKRVIRILTNIILILLLTGMATVVFITANMISASKAAPSNEETLLVLGCQVIDSGPSMMLSERIDAAYEYLIKHPDSIAILSGGKGNDERISEAECMYLELVKKGISPERLMKEEQSTTTYENLSYSKKILEEKGLSNEVAIVTNEYHEYRASIIASKNGLLATAVSASTDIRLLPTFYVRELAAVVYEIIFMA